MEAEDKLDNAIGRMDNWITKINKLIDEKEINTSKKEVKEKPISEKKNYPLHLLIEKSLKDKLKKEAEEQKISLGEYCRRKLRDDKQLNRIERKIDKIIEK